MPPPGVWEDYGTGRMCFGKRLLVGGHRCWAASAGALSSALWSGQPYPGSGGDAALARQDRADVEHLTKRMGQLTSSEAIVTKKQRKAKKTPSR